MIESRRVALAGALLLGVLGAGACAAPSRIEVPSALPNTTQEQFLTLRWAAVKAGGTVRAVGLAASSAGSHWDAQVALEGLDGQGRIASRGSRILRPGFGPGPVAFDVELVPTGGETEFRLRVVRAQRFSQPSR